MPKKPLLSASMVLLLCLIITGCSLGFPSVHRIDIPQGNLLDQDKVAQVKVGMEPRQVRHLLGTPLVTDTFNQNRWDYFYSVRKGSETSVEHHISVFFTDGRVSAIKDQLATN